MMLIKIKLMVTFCLTQVAHQIRAHPSFLHNRRLGVFLLPPGWDASPLHYPQHYICQYLVIGTMRSKVSCSRAKGSHPGQGSKHNHLI